MYTGRHFILRFGHCFLVLLFVVVVMMSFLVFMCCFCHFFKILFSEALLFCLCTRCLLGNQTINRFFRFQFLLHVDQQANAVDHNLTLLYLRGAQPIQVGYIEDAIRAFGVHAPRATALQTQCRQDNVEARLLAEVG